MRIFVVISFIALVAFPSTGWCQDKYEIEEIARERFDELDKNWDHYLDSMELERFRLRKPPKIQEYDFNGDNKISGEEFHKLVQAEVYGKPIEKAHRRVDLPYQDADRNTPLIKKEFDLNVRWINHGLTRPRLLSFSSDRKLAVVTGQTERDESGRSNALVVVDLVVGEVVKTQRSKERYQAATTDENYLYVFHGNKLSKLKRDTLEEVKSIELELEDNKPHRSAIEMKRMDVQSGILFLTMRYGKRYLSAESLEENLELRNNLDASIGLLGPKDSQAAGSKVRFLSNNRIKMGRRVIDCQTGKVSVNFPSHTSSLGFTSFRPLERKISTGISGYDFLHGRQINEKNQILDCTDTVKGAIGIGGMKSLGSFVSPSEPVVYTAYYLKDDEYQKVTIEARQLKDGRLLWSKSIGGFFNEGKPRSIKRSVYGRQLPDQIMAMQFLGNKILFVGSRRVILLDLPSFDNQELTHPFHLVLPAGQVVSSKDVTEIDIEQVGGEGKLRFELVRPFAGVSIDELTGKVTIDGEKLFDDYFDRQGKKEIIYYSPESLERYQERVFELSCKRFEQHVGLRPTEGTSPFFLTLPVSCEDEAKQVAATLFTVVVEVPKKKLEVLIKRAKQIEAERKRKRTESKIDFFIRERAPKGVIDKISLDTDGEIDFTTLREPTEEEAEQIERLIEHAKRRFELQKTAERLID